MPVGTRTPYSHLLQKSAVASMLLGSLALGGCSTGSSGAALTQAEPATRAGITIQGRVHGGAYPIQYATVRLMETQANGYGGAAKQLTSTSSDGLGNFSFDNYMGCDTGQYVYVTVTGGQTISGKVNNNVVQMGVIGSCSVDLANPQSVNVWLSELSTVAAAYALGNFVSISPNDGSGQQIANISAPANNYATGKCTGTGTTGGNPMTCTAAGLAHGFANAFNLVDSVRYDGTIPTGAANTTFPNSANTQATVPAALINTMGNILQSCVDSGGVTDSSALSATSSDKSLCGNLFEYAATPGGAVPLNTLQVALNMAKYPTHNVDALFNLQPPTVFFTPTLASDRLGGTSTLMAYSISIFYKGTGLTGDAGIPYPIDVALDAADDAFVLYSADGTGESWGALDGFAANGTGLFVGAHQTAIQNPAGLAMDTVGHAWATSDVSGGKLYGLYATGTQAGSVYQDVNVPGGYPAAVAVDMANDVWVGRDASDGAQSLFRFGAPASGSTNYASSAFLFAPVLNAPVKRLTVDYNQNAWGVTSSSASATAFGFPYGANNYFAFLESTTLAAPGGYAVVVPRNMEAYFPLKNELNSASGNTVGSISANTAGSLSGLTGSGVPMGAAVDGAGSIFWTDFDSAGQLFMVTPSTGNGTPSAATLTAASWIAFQPCFVVGNTCHVSTTGTNLRGLAIDSSGAMWYVADDSDYAVVETLGLAAPTWPLMSYARSGSTLQ